MMKKYSLLILALFSFTIANAQIRKYYPKSEKDGFVRFLEVGAGAFYGGIVDKQYTGSRYSLSYGANINAKYKTLNQKGFLQVDFNKSGTAFDKAMIGNNGIIATEYAFFLANYPKDNPKAQFDPYFYYLKYDFTQFSVKYGFYIFGSSKSKVAFAPICPSLGFYSMNTRINYIYEGDESEADFTKSTSNFQIGNMSTLHVRFNRINVYAEAHVFSSLKKGTHSQIPILEATYDPQIGGYSIHLGVRYRL